MRKGHLIWILSLTLLSGIAQHASAQWEMIGPDGSPDEILRVGPHLYGITKYGFYRSSDDGDSWKRLEKGLPKPYYHIFELNYDGFEFYLQAQSFHKTYHDKGFYVLGTDETWHYKDSMHDKLYNRFAKRISWDSIIIRLPNYGLSSYDINDTTDTAGVFFSSDRGVTWERRTPLLEGEVDQLFYIKRRAFVEMRLPDTNLTILYHSDDFGLTWDENSFRVGISGYLGIHAFSTFLFAHGARASGGRGDYYSMNNGTSWQGPSWFLDRNPKSVLTVGKAEYALCNDEVYRSLDTGQRWDQIRTEKGEKIYALQLANNGIDLLALVSTRQPDVWKFRKLGSTWLNLMHDAENKGLKTTRQWIVHASDSTLIAIGSEINIRYESVTDSVYRSTDNGTTWDHQRLQIDGLGIGSSPWKKGSKYLYTIGKSEMWRHTVFRSSDGGSQWDNAGPEAFFSNMTISAITNDTLVINRGDTLSNRFWWTTDGGDTWSILNAIHSKGTAYQCFLNGYLYTLHIFQDTVLLRTREGIIWEEVELPRISTQGSIGYEGIFNCDGVLYVTMRHYDSRTSIITFFLYRSTDGGATWSEISNRIGELLTPLHLLQDGSTTYLLAEHKYKIYLEHPLLFASTDRGNTWDRLNSSVPEASTLFATGNDLFLSSPDGGNYRVSKAVASVRGESPPMKAIVYPNPASNRITMEHGAEKRGIYSYTIVGMTGAVVYSSSMAVSGSGKTVFECVIGNLPTGIYCVRITGAGTVQQALFTLQR